MMIQAQHSDKNGKYWKQQSESWQWNGNFVWIFVFHVFFTICASHMVLQCSEKLGQNEEEMVNNT